MGIPCTHRLKRSALVKKKNKPSPRQTRATEITGMQCFSNYDLNLKKKRKKKNIKICMFTLKLSKTVLL